MDKNHVMPGNHYRNVTTAKRVKVLGFSKDGVTGDRRVEYFYLDAKPDDDDFDVKYSIALDVFADTFQPTT